MTDNRPSTRRRWSFRTRLTVILAAIVAAAGAVLVLTQYLILNAVFTTTTGTVVTYGDSADAPSGGPQDPEEAAASAALGLVLKGVANDVLAEMLLWSLALIAVFAILAWLVSWFIVRRAMSRVHQVSATTRQITDQDLTRRLNLPGPEDEIKELGDTIDSMLARLQSAFDAQSRFISNASHELRTPLTATRLTLEVPLEQNRVPEDARPIIERALKTTRRSERLVESLLTLARDPATLMGDATAVPLHEVTAAVIDEITPAAHDRAIEIQADLNPAAVRGNHELLRQMIENLADNAITHNHANGSVIITLAREDQQVVLVLTSTGDTLASEQVENIRRPFERGTTTAAGDDHATTRPGLGLGLSIVDSVAAAHGGELTLAPNPTGGLTATVRLPVMTA